MGGIRFGAIRARHALLLVVPVLLAIAAAAVAASLPGTSRPAMRPVARIAGGPGGQRLDSSRLRALPHDLAGTVGAVRFATRPPRARHLSGTALLSLGDGVPSIAVAAYERAAHIMGQSDQGCDLAWYDLAAIGRVESNNGLTWGARARVSPNGTLFPPIFGPLLDGLGGMPAIPTTDGGVLEHDRRWARAVGPMQFLPSTWIAYAEDGNGDGVKNPQNFYDAALTAGAYLCVNGGNLTVRSGLNRAIYAYNHSAKYVSLVESWIRFYAANSAAAFSSAGTGLLPVGEPAEGGRNPQQLSSGAAGAALARAATTMQASGSFRFALRVRIGATTITGSGAVDTRTSTGRLTVGLPGDGRLAMRVLGRASYVSLPPGLAAAAGTGGGGQWIRWRGAVLARLPSALDAGLAAVSDDLVVVAGQLEGATAAVRIVGHPVLDGVAATEYRGSVDLAVAGLRLGAVGRLANLAAVLAVTQLPMTALVERGGAVKRLVLDLPRLTRSTGAITAAFSFFGLGAPLSITAPVVGGVSPTTTTTTTTVPATTTTTTTTSTTTTTTTTTSTTTTTTTTVPASTSTTTSTEPATSPTSSSGG